MGQIYTREELKGLVDIHNRNKYGVLTSDETSILKVGNLSFFPFPSKAQPHRASATNFFLFSCRRKHGCRFNQFESDRSNIFSLQKDTKGAKPNTQPLLPSQLWQPFLLSQLSAFHLSFHQSRELWTSKVKKWSRS